MSKHGKTKIFIIFLMLLIIPIFFSVSKADDPPSNIDACTEINVSGDYYMIGDIIGSTTDKCINISANNVLFDCQGHTLDGNDVADYGIAVATWTNITITNCILTDWDTAGIYVKYAKGVLLDNITLTSNQDDGIYLYGVQYSNLTNINSSINGDDGLYGYFPNKLNINNSNFDRNTGNGLYIAYASSINIGNITSNDNSQRGLFTSNGDNVYINNISSNNNIWAGVYSSSNSGVNLTNAILMNNSQWDYYFLGGNSECKGFEISNTIGTGNLPIEGYNATFIEIKDKTLSELILCGSRAVNVSNITIYGNNNNGIFINNLIYSKLENITINNTEYGLYSYSSTYNNFTGIMINDTDDISIYLRTNSNNNSLSNMSISDAYIDLWLSYDNIFTNISSNSKSTTYLIFSTADRNIITNSSFIDKKDKISLYIDGSSNNTIYNNIFISNFSIYYGNRVIPNLFYNNIVNATTLSTSLSGIYMYNYWNTTEQTGTRIYGNESFIGGNYWTNPAGTGYSDTCADADDDGFCDSWFNISSNSATTQNGTLVDMLALAKPITIDTTNPSITIKIPTNYTNYTTSYLNFTIEGNEALSNCNFTLDNWATQNVLSNNTNSTGFYYYNSTMKDGYYLAIFWCNDTTGNINNTANVNFGIDTRANYITNITPLSQNYTSGTNFLFNITMNESASVCNMTLNNWASTIDMTATNNVTEFRYNYTQATMSDGLYKVNYSCNDTNGNINNSIGVFFEIDTQAPEITLHTPKSLNYSNSSIQFDITSNEDLSYCAYSLDEFGSETAMTQITPTHYQKTKLNIPEGFYHGNITCIDAIGIWTNDTVGVVFEIDRTNVSINITRPENKTYTSGLNLELNWTANDTHFQSLWYNFDGNGTNTTLTTNTTFNIGEGGRILYAYANDSAGNENSTNVSFTITIPTVNASSVTILKPSGTITTTTNIPFQVIVADSTALSNCTYNVTVDSTKATLKEANTFFDCSDGNGTLTATYITGQTYYFNVFANNTAGMVNDSVQSSFTISSTATPASLGSTTTRYPSEYEEQDYLVCNTSETYWEAKIKEKSSASILIAKKSKRTLNLEINQIMNSSNFTVSCINQDANYNICEWIIITEQSFILNEKENKIIPLEITIPNYVRDFHKYYFNILISDGLNCNGEMPVELKINPIAVIFKTLEKRTFKNYNIPLYIPTALIFIITFVLSIVLNKKSDNIIRILLAFLFSISLTYLFLYLI